MENTKKRKKGKQITALLLAALLTFQNVEIGVVNVVDGDSLIEATVEAAEESGIVQIEEIDIELEKETDDSDEIDKKEWQEEQQETMAEEIAVEEMEIFLDENMEVQEEDNIAKAASSEEVVSSGSCGKNVTYVLDSKGVLTISGSGDMENYSFYVNAPWHSLDIKKIIIGDGVTSIGSYAFYDCSSLTSVEIPSSVTSIESYVFYGCSSLTSVEIPSSVTSIGFSAFEYCSSLTSVEIPSSVTRIWKWAFDGCSSLTSVEIPSSVTIIEEQAFHGCSSLTSVEIPSSVTIIEDQAFFDCSSLTSVEIPSSVTSIGMDAFFGCSSLTSVEIPSSVTIIEYSTFEGCSSLTSVELPSSVTSIGNSAFKGCSSLASVEIPSSVTIIEHSIFEGCSSLTSVEIPSSVTSIGYEAFHDCNELSIIKILNSECDILDSMDTIPEYTIIYGYINSTAQSYAEKYHRTFVPLDTTNENSKKGKCGDNLTWVLDREGENENVLIISGIGDMWNFDNDKNRTPWVDYIDEIQIIKIESGVTSIGSYAFSHCKNISSINIADSSMGGVFWNPVESAIINEGVFYDCSELVTVCIPDNVVKLGELSFGSCDNLVNVTLSKSLEVIDNQVFYNCFQKNGSTCKLIIPENVKSIGKEIFGNVNGLNILFDGDVPIFNDETFLKSSVCAYYPNNTWTDEVRKDYGGKVNWKPRNDWTDNNYFVLKEDTNRWIHNEDSFFNKNEKKYVSTSSEYKEKLDRYNANSSLEWLSYFISLCGWDDKWGACYGLCVSEIAKYLNYYDNDCWGQNAKNFYSFEKPKSNIKLRDIIHYFQLAQSFSVGNDTEKITIKSKKKDKERFWNNLMEETKKSSDLKIPIILGFGIKEYKHSVIICGYDDSFDNMFLFKVYDVNSTSSQYETLFLNTLDYTFSFQDSASRISGVDIGKKWEQLSYLDSDKIMGLLNTIGEKQDVQLQVQTLAKDSSFSETEYTAFLAEYGKAFVLTNSKGEQLICSGDGLDYEASMAVYDATILGEGAERTIIFEIGYDSNFELTNFSDGLFGIQIGNMLYSLDCANVTELFFDSVKGIKFQGENSSYTAYIINEDEIVDKRRVTRSVEGNSSGDVTISYVENSLVLNSENEIKDINGGVYYGSENTDVMITTDVDGNYIIKDSSVQDPIDKPSDKEKEYFISYNLSGGILNENINPIKYTNMTETFTLNNPTKEGYTFIGWTGSNGEIPQITVIIEKGSTGDLSYTANWEQNTSSGDDPDHPDHSKEEEYTISYTLNGGSFNISENPNNYTSKTETFTLNNPIREGYTFIGWTGSNGTTPQKNVTIEKGTTGNLSYTANWKRNTSSNNGSNSNNNSSSDDSDDDNNFLPINTTTSLSGKWIQDKIGWWYKNADSSYPANKWQFINGKWYFFDKAGYMVTGWILSNNKWYYLDTNGAMLENSWVFYKNHWYFLKDSNGDMATGWISWKNQWYYLNQDGSMKTGWLFDRNIWYYLNENGDMAVNSITPDGYSVDSNGAWISED